MKILRPLNNSLASKFRNLGNIPQNQIMRVQQKVGNVGGHFTLLERSKDHGIRNWGDGCCRLDEAFCSLWRHDHTSDVLMYFARDTWDISFPCLFWISWLTGCFPDLDVLFLDFLCSYTLSFTLILGLGV